jgi:hypothetical protein
LLLGIAGLLYAIRGQAADPSIVTTMISIFLVPGAILFVLGMMPGPALSEHTKMVFSPGRLASGLAAVAAGIAIVYAGHFLHLPPPILVVGMFFVPAGLLYAAGCWGQGCSNCGVLLEEFRAQFNASHTRALETAIVAAGVSDILALHRSKPESTRTLLLLRYCPRCLGAGLLTGQGGARSGLRPDQVKPLLAGLKQGT